MFDHYAEIVFRLPLNQTFSYKLPPDIASLARPGMRMRAPFRNRVLEGMIVEVHQNQPNFLTEDILELLDDVPILTSSQMKLGKWMAEYYLAGIGECIYKMFPGGTKKSNKKQNVEKKSRLRIASKIKGASFQTRHSLNAEQMLVYQEIKLDITGKQTDEKSKVKTKSSQARTHLIHGVTGSGKTELYIHLIIASLESGRGAILLTPEITLTVQLIERLSEVFSERLALLHSGLRPRQRLQAYQAVLRGDKDIVVGTRSAIFVPIKKPGLIIIDEEHDMSYKEHSAPRYHARQIAYRICETEGAVLALGSATPSLESRSLAESSRASFRYHRLKERTGTAKLPHVQIIPAPDPDIPLSGRLTQALDATIKEGHQAILLLNRRGYIPFLFCRKCEAAIVCKNCSVTLRLHRDGSLVCHYCNYKRKDNARCDRCGEKTKRLGAGTQKLEEYLLRLFPNMRIERLDSDTAHRAGIVEQTIERLVNAEIDVLIGTQMIAKGLDAPGVTLVGVLQADMGLNMPDFRAAERTFSLLTQVAGRAGRGEWPGKVYFEVLNPDSPIIQFACNQDYDAFFAAEIIDRQRAGYPPYSRILRLLYRATEEETAKNAANQLKDLLLTIFSDLSEPKPVILGPAPAPLSKLHMQYRFHIIIKMERTEIVRRLLLKNLDEIRKIGRNDVYLEIDFDAQDLL